MSAGAGRAVDAAVVALILALSATVLFHRLGEASLIGDEAIYAQVAAEAANEGRWLPPTFLDRIHLHKPPLKMWLVAGSFRLFGQTEFSARLPDALLGVIFLVAIYLAGKRHVGRAAALCASLLLLGAPQFVFQHGLRDSVQEAAVVLLALVMLCNWLLAVGRQSGPRVSMLPAGVSASALAFVKNPLGVFLSGVLILQALVEMFLRRRGSVNGPAPVFGVAAVAVGCWLGWVTYLGTVTDGRYYAFLLQDLVERSTEGLNPNHLHGAGFYLSSLLRDFGAWWLFGIPAAWHAGRGLRRDAAAGDRVALHLAAWTLAIVAAFSVPVSKNAWYIYPAYPAIAMLLGLGVVQAGKWVARAAGNRARVVAATAVGAALAVQVAGAWQTADGDRRRLDIHRFAEAYRQNPGTSLSVELASLRRQGQFRSWNIYYLYWLPGVRWNRGGLPLTESPGCHYAVVPQSEPYLARGWLPVLDVNTVVPKAAPIHVVGTCPLDVRPG